MMIAVQQLPVKAECLIRILYTAFLMRGRTEGVLSGVIGDIYKQRCVVWGMWVVGRVYMLSYFSDSWMNNASRRCGGLQV